MTQSKTEGGLLEVFLVFLKLGLTSFGGPAAHLGYFRKELVEHRRWVNDNQFSQLLAISQFLPGPSSSQLGFSLGLIRSGWSGATAAFLAFTLPSAILMLGFASILPLLEGRFAQAVLHGLKIAAFAVVADAVVGMSRALCPDIRRKIIAIVAAIIILLAAEVWIQLAVIVMGGLLGLLVCQVPVKEANAALPIHYSRKLSVVWLLLYFVLLLLLPFLAMADKPLMALADSFYRAGALVFGGGHVVLPLLADSVVASGDISKETFLAGYGLAQIIPGPMFSFSAYLGAVMDTGYAAWVGAIVALLSVFLPGFLLMAAVLPLWNVVPPGQSVRCAIAGVNAAVVGILAAALYEPIFTSAIKTAADLLIGVAAFMLLTFVRISPLLAVACCVAGSVLWSVFLA